MDRQSSLFERGEPAGYTSSGVGTSQTCPPEGQGAPISRDSEPSHSGTFSTLDRRDAHRVDVDLDVSLGTHAHYFTAQARDLSHGGLFVETYRALALGEELSVEFEVPAGRVIATGVVRWVREAHGSRSPGYGIAFQNLSRFTRPLIDCFCRSLAPAPPSCRMAG
jgi:uncharacterized protein (TIGR02266 family)